MRGLAFFLLILVAALAGGFFYVKRLPYKMYSDWVQGREWNKYYMIRDYQKSHLNPNVLEETLVYKEDYPQLWKPFQLRNSLVPLPTRHPLFITIPVVELKHKSAPPVIGMIIAGPNKREISTIYTLATNLSQDYTRGQELFKLPYVRNRIMKIGQDELWKDIFSKEIIVKDKSFDEMIHDLYIIHIRSKLLPAGTLSYGLMKDGKALVELSSKDKDYKVELVMTKQGQRIYSYVLKTALTDPESVKLRSKYLNSISFSPIDPDMGRIIYTEFKTLNFARQVDQEGLLYLFSAWTQEIDKFEILKEMIFYLERGRSNNQQLKALYKYAFQKYGKTFTTRNILTESDDQDILLQRKIELEDIEKKYAAEKALTKTPELIEMSPEEKMKVHLKKAKEDGPTESEDMTVH